MWHTPVIPAFEGEIRGKRDQKFKIILGYIMGLKAGLEHIRPCQKKRRAGRKKGGKRKITDSNSPDIDYALTVTWAQLVAIPPRACPHRGRTVSKTAEIYSWPS